MLPISWKPVPADGLVLIGPLGDGGYVASEAAMKPVRTLISMGLYDDWRFEEDFRRRTGAKVVCFDHSVTTKFWLLYTVKALLRRRFHQLSRFVRYRRFFGSPEVRHERLMVGQDAPGVVSLDTILKSIPADEPLFLKMDIEGGEYSILDQLVAARSRFTGMVMELHEIDKRRAEVERFFDAMPEFTIVAMHPNNYFPPDKNGDPLLLEVSLMRSEFVHRNPKARVPALPRTIPANPDIPLNFG